MNFGVVGFIPALRSRRSNVRELRLDYSSEKRAWLGFDKALILGEYEKSVFLVPIGRHCYAVGLPHASGLNPQVSFGWY